MFEQAKKTNTIGKKVAKPFIPPKQEVKTEEFGLTKYMESIPKPKKKEVHLLSYFYNDQSMAYQINSNSTKRLAKNEFDAKIAVKEVQGLVIKKTQLNMKESNSLYICRINLEEEKEEKVNESS